MIFKSDIDVKLVSSMGNDLSVIKAAIVSTGGKIGKYEEFEAAYGLINYLMKHRHGTPFEHASMTFFVDAPVFVWREFHRHRVGFCLPESVDIHFAHYIQRGNRLKPSLSLWKYNLKKLHNDFNRGINSDLIQKPYIPFGNRIKCKPRLCNENTMGIETGELEDVYDSGIKEIWRLETYSQKYPILDATSDHRVLTKEGYKKLSEIEKGDLIGTTGLLTLKKRNQLPAYLDDAIKLYVTSWRKHLINPIDYCRNCKQDFNRDQLVLDHVEPVAKNLKLALDEDNLEILCKECHQLKTAFDQKYRNIPRAGCIFEKIYKKPYLVREERTYDIAMKGPWHNFIADGFIVHNSYNEVSARYKQLEPVFWVPDRNRKMIPSEKHTSARPDFVRLESDEDYEIYINSIKLNYAQTYALYDLQVNHNKIAKEVARSILPVGIYSQCYVTCNPRSLMHFLSLRVHDPNAMFVSYPQNEIEVAAKKCEIEFANLFPLIHKSFTDNRRVAP